MRDLWLIWRNPLAKNRRRYKVGLLSVIKNDNSETYVFKYTNPELNDAIKDGFDGFPGFDNLNKKEYISEPNRLFSNIEQRLPDPKRPDYLDILNNHGLNSQSNVWEILSATKGRLETDNFEFIQVFNKTKIEFDLAGTRYCSDFQKCKEELSDNDKLILELEPTNELDSKVIKVIFKNIRGEKYHIGYVPRYYSDNLASYLAKDIKYSAIISKVRRETRINDKVVSVKVNLIFE